MGNEDKWWLKNFNISEIWSKGFTGKGIKIAVLDTGISYPHPDLELDPELFKDVTNSVSGPNDLQGHGTHCIGIIKASDNTIGSTGIAYNSLIYPCKITHDEDGDTTDYLIKGINWAISQNVDIISISKGDPFEDSNLEAVITEADNQGILVVASSGNKTPGYASDHIYYPARYPVTLSVGGIDENNSPLSDSILTGETNIYAPGKEILSTYPNNSFKPLSGSSQATPYVAGICALILEFERRKQPGCKAKETKDIILANASVSDLGKIINISNVFN
jgi:subtilisin family serine protease